jgi:TRAP-type transport system periplasmic protein
MDRRFIHIDGPIEVPIASPIGPDATWDNDNRRTRREKMFLIASRWKKIALATAIAPVMLAALAVGNLAQAADLVYGSWPPARNYMNSNALPYIFDRIDKDTNGAIKWRLIPGGQIADGKSTFTAVRDGLMQAGMGVATYVPNIVPSVTAIYSTLLFGDDVVAASGAALETITLHCPSCLEEYRKMNAVPLAGWDAAPYQLMCRDPVKTVEDLKGKRIRATGGNAEMLKIAGAVPIAGTLTEAVTLLQRGGIDCVLGATEWLRAYGYADFAKWVSDYPLGMSGPAIGLLMNRKTWDGFTTEQKKLHLKYAGHLVADMAISNFILSNEKALTDAIKDKGVKMVATEKPGFDQLVANYRKIQLERNIKVAEGFGVKDPAPILAAYDAAFEKWKGLSKGIGRDVEKLSDAIWTEIYSKVDPATF